jgi:hypothetical protein
MNTKVLVPVLAAGVGAILLWKHNQATKAAAMPAPVHGMGTYTKPFASPFRSHLQPMAVPGSFWSEGGWVGPAAVQKGRNYTFAPQVAPLVVDGHVDDSGTPILGQGPAGAPAVRCLVDPSGTILQVLRPSWKQDDNMAGVGSFFSSISNDFKRAESFVSHTPLRIMLNPALQIRQGAQGITQVAQAAGQYVRGMPVPTAPASTQSAAAAAASTSAQPVGSAFTYGGYTWQVVAPGVVQQAVPTSTAAPAPVNLNNAPVNPFGSPSNQAPVPVIAPVVTAPVIAPVTAPVATPVATPAVTPVAPAATPVQLSASQQAWINQWQQDIVQAQTQGNTAAIAQLQAQIAAMQAGTYTGPMDGMGAYQSRQARLVRGQPRPAVYGSANPNLRASTVNRYGRPHAQYSAYPGTRLMPGSSPVAGFGDALAGVSAGMGDFLAGLFGLGEAKIEIAPARAQLPNGKWFNGYVTRQGVFHVAVPMTASAMNGLGALGFSFSSAVHAVEQSVEQPVKLALSVGKVALAPLAATAKLVQTGSFSAAASTFKSDTLAPVSTVKAGIQSMQAAVRKPAAVGATTTTTATGWPAAWTPVPGLNADWTYGDAGDGTYDGVIQNVVVGIGITATPTMLTAAGGSPNPAAAGAVSGASPVTVINQYLAANPTTASALAAYPADAAGLTLPAGTVASTTATGTTATGPVGPSGWPLATTLVPGYSNWYYSDANNGSGNGLIAVPGSSTPTTYTLAQIQAVGSNPATLVQQMIAANPALAAATVTAPLTTTPGTGVNAYNWPTIATAVPGFPAWTYMIDPAGSGGGAFSSTSLGRSFLVPATMLATSAGNPATCVTYYEGSTGSPVAGSAAYYNWPLVATAVPSNPAWTYVANFDGTGNATFTYATTGTTAVLTPAMIMAAGGNPSTALANYLAANPAVQAQITAATAAQTAYGPSGAGYDDDTGSGATIPWDGVPGDPGDPNAPGGAAATGQVYDANGNPISPGGGGGATPPLPAAPAPAGGLHWGWVAGAAVAVPGFLYLKAKGHI